MDPSSKQNVLYVFADYGASTPLWGDGLISDLDGLGISSDLQKTMRRASEVFNEFVLPEAGWKSEERRREYVRLIDESVHGLTVELGPRYTIIRG